MNPLVAVLLMALVTYLPRVLPMLVFRRKIKSRFIQSFLKYVPYSVLAALTIPDIFYSTSDQMTALIGAMVALVLSYFERSLVIVALGAVFAVYLTSLII